MEVENQVETTSAEESLQTKTTTTSEETNTTPATVTAASVQDENSNSTTASEVESALQKQHKAFMQTHQNLFERFAGRNNVAPAKPGQLHSVSLPTTATSKTVRMSMPTAQQLSSQVSVATTRQPQQTRAKTISTTLAAVSGKPPVKWTWTEHFDANTKRM